MQIELIFIFLSRPWVRLCSLLPIQRFWFRFQHCHIFSQVLGLEQSPLSLVRINEELHERKELQLQSRKLRLTAKGICYAHHAESSNCKSLNYFTSSGGQSVGILSLRTKSHRVRLLMCNCKCLLILQSFLNLKLCKAIHARSYMHLHIFYVCLNFCWWFVLCLT
jgi:hypothetical protein